MSDIVGLERALYDWTPLVGKKRRLQAATDLAQAGTADAVRALVKALVQSSRPLIADQTWELLLHLAGKGVTGARETLCTLALHHAHKQASRVVLEHGYVPQEPSQRALFYFLTEQWEAYETLDFDGRLLKTTYTHINKALRSRVATLARKTGRVAWADVMTGARQGVRLRAMSTEEWRAVLTLLVAERRWSELSRLAQTSPLLWSQRIVMLLKKAAWPPVGSPEYQGFQELVRLAEHCSGDPLTDGEYLRNYACLQGHQGKILSLALSADEQWLLSGGSDATLRWWHLPDGDNCVVRQGDQSAVTALVATPDSRILASGHADGPIHLWDLQQQAPLHVLAGHQGPVSLLKLTPDGQTLISGGRDGLIQLWRLSDGKLLAFLKGHKSSIATLALNSDGTLLASAGLRETRVRLWSLPDGELLGTLPACENPGLLFTADGETLLVGHYFGDLSRTELLEHASGYGGQIVRWKLPQLRENGVLWGHRQGVGAMALTPDGALLVSGSRDNEVRLWKAPFSVISTRLRGPSLDVTRLAIGAEGRLLAAGGMINSLWLWQLPTGRFLGRLANHREIISAFDFTSSGRMLVSTGWDGRINLYSMLPTLLPVWPLSKFDLDATAWLMPLVADETLAPVSRAWFKFTLAMLRWRHRFDIEVADAPQCMEVGAFDIEIDG